MRKASTLSIIMTIMILVSSVTLAQERVLKTAAVPHVFDYQGLLTDPDGQPYDGAFDVRFEITNAAGDSVLYDETVNDLAVTGGLLHHLIGSVGGDLDPLVFRRAAKLRITVDGETLSPDIVIAPAPVAMVALHAASLIGGSTGGETGGRLTLTSPDSALVVETQNAPAIVATVGQAVMQKARGQKLGGDSFIVNAAVQGVDLENAGVHGGSWSGDGVIGDSQDGRGVVGISYSDIGVDAWSTSGIALKAQCENGLAGHFEGDVSIWGEVNIYGQLKLANGLIRVDTDGEIYAKSFHTSDDQGTGTAAITRDGASTFKSVSSDEGMTTPRDGGGTAWYDGFGTSYFDAGGTEYGSWTASSGNLYTRGNLAVGGAKNAVVETPTYGRRLLYAEESAEVYFKDRGHGRLIGGTAVIELDPMFLETVTAGGPDAYHVQITLTADCNGVFVSEKSDRSFTVKELMGGTSDASFDWEVAAKRRGYEAVRMEEYVKPSPPMR